MIYQNRFIKQIQQTDVQLKQHILFLTTSNLATNPRLIKELRLAIEMGLQPEVVYFQFDNWSKEINRQLEDELAGKVHLHAIAGGRDPFLPWLMSTTVEEVGKIASRWINHPYIIARSNKRTHLLLQYLRRLRSRSFKMVVAHNPGALYPAWSFSRLHNIPFGFDVEDYHPGETKDKNKRAQMIKMFHYLGPHASYISAASPLILDYTLRDLKRFKGSSLVINNYFSITEFSQAKSSAEGKLKLVWFSQHIAEGRGLETIIPVIESLSELTELHLYGNLQEHFFDNHIKGISNIFIHPPLSQQELHHKLADYDIGLALENLHSNFNRDICITNKILAYYQAGLYIIASKTSSQVLFMQEHPMHGELVSLEKSELENVIKKSNERKLTIRQKKDLRVESSKVNNWETESLKLKKIWQQIL